MPLPASTATASAMAWRPLSLVARKQRRRLHGTVEEDSDDHGHGGDDHDHDEDDGVVLTVPDTLEECNSTITALQARFSAGECTCSAAQVDPCLEATLFDPHQSVDMHIVAVFVVLLFSALGVALPLLAKRFAKKSPRKYYVLALGKSVGTGVVISVGLVHMLLPAALSLQNECTPTSFHESYPAYPYLFVMIAAFLAHGVQTVFGAADHHPNGGHVHGAEAAVEELSHTGGGAAAASFAAPTPMPSSASAAQKLNPDAEKGIMVDASVDSKRSGGAADASTTGSSATDDIVTRRTMVQSIVMEVAFTIHSVLVGLVLGFASSQRITALLVALVFHQFFEGLALGARLVDAGTSMRHNLIVLTIFAVSAPVGIAVGTALRAGINPLSMTYLLTSGILDSMCAGLLLYVGFEFLLVDFPVDVRRVSEHDADNTVALKRLGMLVAVWFGAGVMATIGIWL